MRQPELADPCSARRTHPYCWAAEREDGYELIPVLIDGVEPESVEPLLGADVVALSIDDRPGAITAAMPRLLGAVPAPPPHTFVGRSRLLLRAARILCSPTDGMMPPAAPSGDGPGRYVVFRGDGGEGQTALASEAARWRVLSRRFRRAAFVSLEDHGDARKVLWKLGDQLVPNFGAQAGSDDRRVLDLVRCALQERATILVFDNMESVLPPGGFDGAGGFAAEDASGIGKKVPAGGRDVLSAPSATEEVPVGGRDVLSASSAAEEIPAGGRDVLFEPEVLAGVLGLAASKGWARAPGKTVNRAIEAPEGRQDAERKKPLPPLRDSCHLSSHNLEPAVPPGRISALAIDPSQLRTGLRHATRNPRRPAGLLRNRAERGFPDRRGVAVRGIS